MRRGFAVLCSVSALGMLAPTAFGQYANPYGPAPMQYAPNPYAQMPYAPNPYAQMQYAPMPMPMQYAPQYGYPTPARPMYYQPPMMQQQAPMWQGPGGANTKVFVYGPLLEEGVAVPANPVADPPRPLPIRRGEALAPVKQAQALPPALPTMLSHGGYPTLPTYSKADLMPEACGSACGDGPACGPGCAPPAYEPPMRGHGHFIGEVGASFLVPIFNTRTAYNTTAAGGISAGTDFTHVVDVAPSASVGYIFHTGWGVRADFLHVNGAVGTSLVNADPTVNIATPTGPLGILSPSPALINGIGVDQFKFTQRISADIADIEIVKEASFLDTTFLFSFGGRYARFLQSYSATRTNPGGSNGVTSTAFDREDLDVSNYFQGFGPTVSMDVVHPLTRWGLSAYGTARGSFLWGTDRFAQNYHLSNTSGPVGVVPAFTDTANSFSAYESRYVTAVESEGGLQYGCRLRSCYVFIRAGATFQRWWDVGNPTTARGNLNFVGGTAKVGITF